VFISPVERTYKLNLLGPILAGIPLLICLVIALVDYTGSGAVDSSIWVANVLSAVFLAAVWLLVSRYQITTHSEGASYVSPFKSIDMRWDDVVETRFSQNAINAGAHFGLIGALVVAAASRGASANTQKQLELVDQSGNKLKITANWRNTDEFIRQALARVNPRVLQQLRQRLQAGETISFGDLKLSPAGVVWKQKELIPYASLVKAQIAVDKLRVKTEGKWLDNIAVNLKKVPNVFVALDLIADKRSGSATTPVDPLVRAAGVGA